MLRKNWDNLFALALGIVWGFEIFDSFATGNYRAGINAIFVAVFFILCELMIRLGKEKDGLIDTTFALVETYSEIASKAVHKLHEATDLLTLTEIQRDDAVAKYQELLKPVVVKEMKSRKTKLAKPVSKKKSK